MRWFQSSFESLLVPYQVSENHLKPSKVSAEYRAKSEMKVKEKNKVSGKKQAWRVTQLKRVLLLYRARFMSGVCMCRAGCKRQHALLRSQAEHKRCHGVWLTNCNSRHFVIWKLRLVNVTVAIERIPVDVYEQDVLNTWQNSNMERSNSSFSPLRWEIGRQLRSPKLSKSR